MQRRSKEMSRVRSWSSDLLAVGAATKCVDAEPTGNMNEHRHGLVYAGALPLQGQLLGRTRSEAEVNAHAQGAASATPTSHRGSTLSVGAKLRSQSQHQLSLIHI